MTAFNIALPGSAPVETVHQKPVMDEHERWITAPYALRHDEKGWHDRPLDAGNRKALRDAAEEQFFNAHLGDTK